MGRKSSEPANFTTKIFQDFSIHIHISPNRKKSFPGEGRTKGKVFIYGDGCGAGFGFIDCWVFFLLYWVLFACILFLFTSR